MAEVASAYVTLVPSARGFGTAINRQVGPQVNKAGAVAGAGLGRSMLKGFIAIGAITAITGFVKDAFSEAREAQKVGALTDQVIKTTGGSAKVTAAQVERLSEAFSKKTGIDDEQIQKGANLVLTFKNIARQGNGLRNIFGRVVRGGADLAAAGFGSVESASKQLAKAVNDPEKGLTALTRAGVTFTKKQTERIKGLVTEGKTFKAQKAILREVESQVKGAAEAQATSGDKARVAYDNLKEQIGTALLPVVDKLATFFTNKIAPAISGFVTNLTTGQGKAGAFGDFIKNRVIPVLSDYYSWIFHKVVPAIRDALGKALEQGKKAFNKIRDAVKENEPEIRQLLNAVKSVVKFWATKLVPKAIEIASHVLPILGKAIGIVIDLAAFWVRAFNKARDVIGTVREAIGKAAGKLKDAAAKITGAFKGIPAKLKAIGGNIIDGLVAGIKAAAGKVADAVGAIVDKIPKKIRSMMGISSPSKVTRLLGEFIGEGLAQGIGSKNKRIANALQTVIDGVKSKLATLRDEFASISDSVAGAFTGDLFGAETAGDFVSNLLGTRGQLKSLKAAFKKLLGFGVKPAFLSQLFASGNAGLILDLAAGSKAQANQAASLFGQVGSLSASLGNQVAQADIGPKIDKTNATLDEIAHLLKLLPPGIGKEINGAARAGKRRSAA